MKYSLAFYCFMISFAYGSSCFVTLAKRIDADLDMPSTNGWAQVITIENKKAIIDGLQAMTNGMNRAEIVKKFGSPDEETKGLAKGAKSARESEMMSYFLKRKNLCGYNMQDWTLSFVVDKNGVIDYIMYMKNGKLEKIECADCTEHNGDVVTSNKFDRTVGRQGE